MPKFLSDGHFSGSSADLAVDGVLDVTGKIKTANSIELGQYGYVDFGSSNTNRLQFYNSLSGATLKQYGSGDLHLYSVSNSITFQAGVSGLNTNYGLKVVGETIQTPVVYELGDTSVYLDLGNTTTSLKTAGPIITTGVNQFKSVGGTGSAVAIELKGNSSASNSDYLAKSTIYTRYDTTTPYGANNNSMMLFKVGKGTDAFQHTVLTLDSSLDATFAGNVIVSGTSSTFNTGNSGTFVTNDANNYARLTMTSASAQLGLFRAGDGGMYIGGSSSGFRLYTASFSQKFLVDQSGNATISGDALVNGGLKIAGGTDAGSQLCLFADSNGHTSLAGYDFQILNGGNNSRARTFFINSTGATFSGTVSASNLSGTNTGDQTLPTLSSLGALPLAGGTMTGDIVLGSNAVTGTGNSKVEVTDVYAFRYKARVNNVDDSTLRIQMHGGTTDYMSFYANDTEQFRISYHSSYSGFSCYGDGKITGNLAIGAKAANGSHTNGSPQLFFSTGNTHYNWMIAAQESTDACLELSVGDQDGTYSSDTYTPVLRLYQTGASEFAGDVFSDGLYVNATSAVAGTQVAIVQDGSQNLQRWGSTSDGASQASYRFRIDQNFEFIGNSSSADTITLKSSDGSASFAGNVTAPSFIGTATNSTQLNGFTLARIDNAEAFHTLTGLNASGSQAKRYHIGRLYGCPAHWDGNWQNLEIRATAESYESGHMIWRILGDYGGAGTQAGMMDLYLKEATGPMCNRFNITLGTPVDAGWDHSGQDTYYVDLYVDAAYYSQWEVNIKTYGHGTQNSNPTSGGATTVIYDSPTSTNISDFNVTHASIKHLDYEIYHEGHKPTLTELGAAASSTAITSLAFSGSTTKTLTLTQQGGGTITGSFVDTGGSSGITQAAGDTRYVNVTGDTMTGDLTINSSGLASSPMLRLNNSESSAFNHAIEAINSNLTAGEAEIFVFGKATNTKNSGYIGYNWAADASNNNYVSIGQWGQNHIFRVYGDQVLSTVTLRSDSDVRGTLFYDTDNTGYYLNPKGQSILGSLKLDGIISGTSSGCAEFGRNHAYHTPEIKGYGAELMIGAQNAGIHINYRTCNNGASGHTPNTWYWRAGSASSWSDHNFGKVFANGYVSANEFYDLSNTAYYVDPAGTSKINKIEHKGLSPTTGTDIDQIKEFSMSFQLSADTWTDTGINATDLASGTYAVQMRVQDYGVNGGHYDEYYSGMMSWYSGNTNDVNVDEILLHRAGHAPQSGTIQLRTERTYSADANDLMLQVKSNLPYNAALDNSNSKYMRFKFRRLI